MSQSDEVTLPRSPTPIIVPSTTATSGSLSAAISALPNELLAEIFLAGQEDQSLPPWPKYVPFIPVSRLSSLSLWSPEIPFEILVSRVSPHWRILAHDTPRLWTSVVLDTQDKNHLKNAADYIQRSGALSLDVFVRVLPYRRQTPLTIPAICRLISAEVERLQTLRVESEAEPTGVPCLQVFFKNMPKSAPHLQTLDIRLSGRIPYRLPLTVSAFPDGLPRLKSLHFVNISPHNIILPQYAITSLQLHQCAHHVPALRGASQSLSAITQLILSESYILPEWAYVQLMLPSLKGLYLRYSPACDLLVSRIVAPELDTLYLETMTEDEMADIIAASHSPETQSCKFPRLRSFMLRLTATYGLWHAVMDAFQQVTHFTLLGANISNFLVPFSASHTPWPMLAVLSLPNMKARLLADVISALSNRANMGYPVRRLQLSPTLFADGESLWHSAGIDVEVVINPLTSLPAECRAEEWEVEDELEGGWCKLGANAVAESKSRALLPV
ncbi:hypothetical protein FIBSPDRAFT_1038926 [Athelia psychrophila]|uniref:Uncharacterized protein n=1 Tax=Athelia psychrophila TaxID=1759441 RepID=A0A166SBC0_9AGAM|nr:hypothetical protein FIBSPDRAFT_1038926 [Fibularhizoctonia sp. CBS 109695]